MKILRKISDFQKVKKGCVLTIGNFDGVHLGHQEILAAARQTTAERRAKLIVMTFEPHPLAVLYPQKALGILTPLVLKKHLLAELGADYLCIAKTDLELLGLSPKDFVEQFIVKNIQPDVVVEGENFNFGSGRTGSVDVLGKLGTEMGFEVSIVKAKKIKLLTGKMEIISSTLVRDLLTDGRVADAAIALGRPYTLIGKIVPGRGKGKQIGFPTANLDCHQKSPLGDALRHLQPTGQLVPQQGVYAGFVGIADSQEQACATKERIPAAFSIGRSEDVCTGESLLIEAHLLIEDVGPLYGKWLAMDFIERLREQQRFKTDAELSAQIAKDCIVARKILN